MRIEVTARDVAIGLAWHDVTCPEGADCRDRGLHAMGQPVVTSGVVHRFLDRLAELSAPDTDREGLG